MRAVAKARSGDTEGAIEDLRSIRRLAVHVGSEPALLSLLVRQMFDRTALNSTRRVASVVAEDREALRLLLKLLREDRPEASLEFALRGEMYLGLTTIRNLEVFGRNRGREDKGLDSIPLDTEKLVRDGIPDDIMRKAFMAQHAEFWIEANKDMSKHRGDPVALGEAFDALAEREFEKPTASKLLNAILWSGKLVNRSCRQKRRSALQAR